MLQVVERPMRRLKTLLDILQATANTRAGLLVALAAALLPWHRHAQHLQQHQVWLRSRAYTSELKGFQQA